MQSLSPPPSPPLIRDEAIMPYGPLPSKPTQQEMAQIIWDASNDLADQSRGEWLDNGTGKELLKPCAWTDDMGNPQEVYAAICLFSSATRYLTDDVVDPYVPARDRYRDVLCRGDNRVGISGKKCWPPSINASWIAFGDKLYIAAQGPRCQRIPGETADTMSQFYTMVAESKAPLVISLGKETEQGRRKFSAPWDPRCYQGIEGISVEVLTSPESWTERRLTVPDHICRSIHFAEWPDNGEADVEGFLALVKLVRENPGAIIHCSAGIGRTGCILVAIAVLEEMKRSGFVEGDDLMRLIATTILRLRLQRVGLVNSPAQLEMLYNALTQWVKS